MDALTIAQEFRAEAVRLHGLANAYIEIAMRCDGTHFSLPDDVRASHEEQLERMTPAQRERIEELERRWLQREELHG